MSIRLGTEKSLLDTPLHPYTALVTRLSGRSAFFFLFRFSVVVPTGQFLVRFPAACLS